MTVLDLLRRRFAALAAGDYETVYASYCEDAPFLQQFSDRATYLRFAQKQLSAIKVISWRSLKQRRLDAEAEEHLLIMEIAVGDGRQYFYELALLRKTADGWRYHSAQKLSGEDYSGPPEQLDFCHFDSIAQKIRF